MKKNFVKHKHLEKTLDSDNLLEYSKIKQVVSKKRGWKSCYILFS